MERLFFRDRQETNGRKRGEPKNPPMQQLHIAVTGLGRGVGTTFVANALAFYFCHRGMETAFCQCMTPSKADRFLFDEVSMEQRFTRRNFVDVYERIAEGLPLGGGLGGRGKRINEEDGISWILPTTESRDLAESQRSRLLSVPRGAVCVYDFEADAAWNPLLLDMDMLVVVVDPLPSRMIHDKERFRFLKKLELSGCKVIWVVNRSNPGVSLRQVKSYLKTNQIVQIPVFSAERIYRCEYTCRFPWEEEEIQRKMLEIFTFLFQKESNYSIIL